MAACVVYSDKCPACRAFIGSEKHAAMDHELTSRGCSKLVMVNAEQHKLPPDWVKKGVPAFLVTDEKNHIRFERIGCPVDIKRAAEVMAGAVQAVGAERAAAIDGPFAVTIVITRSCSTCTRFMNNGEAEQFARLMMANGIVMNKDVMWSEDAVARGISPGSTITFVVTKGGVPIFQILGSAKAEKLAEQILQQVNRVRGCPGCKA